MFFRIEFKNGSETYEHAKDEKAVRELVAAIYPNKEVAVVEEANEVIQ